MAKAQGKGKEVAAKTAPKKAIKPAAAKATKRAKTGKVKQGDRYSCDVCGLVVSVDEACGCVEPYDIVCCGQQMERNRTGDGFASSLSSVRVPASSCLASLLENRPREGL